MFARQPSGFGSTQAHKFNLQGLQALHLPPGTGVGGWHRMSRCRWVAPFVRFRSARCRWPAFAPEGYGAAGARCRWVAPNVPVSVGGIVRPVSERPVSVARLRPGGLRRGRGAVSVGGTECPRCRWVASFVRCRNARCRWPAFAPEGYGAAGARCRWVAPKGQDVGAAFAPGLSVGGTECHATSWARSRSRLANSPRGSNRSSIQCRNHVPQHHLHSLR